jgi:hypothetical protein
MGRHAGSHHLFRPRMNTDFVTRMNTDKFFRSVFIRFTQSEFFRGLAYTFGSQPFSYSRCQNFIASASSRI